MTANPVVHGGLFTLATNSGKGLIEVHANKRWLSKRRKELDGDLLPVAEAIERTAVDYALEQMSDAKRAASFRKQLKARQIRFLFAFMGTRMQYSVVEGKGKLRSPPVC